MAYPHRHARKNLRSQIRRTPPVRRLGGLRGLQAQRGSERRAVRHRDPAAERHRFAAHRPRAEQHPAGRAHPLPPHARQGRPVAAGHRPRGHRHADGRRAPAGRRRQHRSPRHGPRGFCRQGLGMEGRERRDHHQPAAPPGRVVRLVARAFHPGRGPVGRRPQGVRPALQAEPALSRQAPGQLGPAVPDRHLRPRGRAEGGRRRLLALRLSAGRRRHLPAPDRLRRRG